SFSPFIPLSTSSSIFLSTHTPTTSLLPLSLHDALPISARPCARRRAALLRREAGEVPRAAISDRRHGVVLRHRIRVSPLEELPRSEEHTSELQSHLNLVCRLLLEKKKTAPQTHTTHGAQ